MWITKFKKLTKILTFNQSTHKYCTRPAYYHRVGSYPLIYRTLGEEIERSAEKFHNREAFIACQENERITFGEALNKADHLAGKFLKLGLQPGDHIGLWAPNTIQWFITFLAAARANLVIACINPALEVHEIKFSLNKAKCKAVIAQEQIKTHNFYNILKHAIPELENSHRNEIHSKSNPHLKYVIIDTENDLKGVNRFYDLMKASGNDSDDLNALRESQKIIDPDRPLVIQFTSGTTGKPKAALLTSFNFVNSSSIFGQRIGIDNPNFEHRLLLQAPLFHAFGLTIFMANLLYGSTLVIPCPTYNAMECLRMVEKEKCTYIMGSPTMLIDAMAEQSRHNFDTSSLRTAVTGGSTCTPQVYRDVKKVFNLQHFNVVYGLSEATAADFASLGCERDSLLEKTVGKIYDHLEAKVINDQGHTVRFGQPGELCMRGFAIMKEYFEDEQKTKEILSNDGWLRTGDQFILYETGYGSVVGRKKDIIIRGGENIFPKEIEDFLDTHPDVLESQVIGVPDKRLGEEIYAFIRMKDNRPDLTLDAVKKFSEGEISHFKIPKYVHVLKEFPKTTSGKIQKFKLKEMANIC